MRTPDEILDLYEQRKKHYLPLHASMAEIRDVYDGRATVTLPDVPDDLAASVPNLLAQGVDQMAGRIASTAPMAAFSPDTPGTRRAERRADTAEKVIHGWWQADRHHLKNPVRARRLIAYGMSPVSIRWDKDNRPCWQIRDPLETYPNPDQTYGFGKSIDVLFAYKRTVGWLKAHGYGDAVERINMKGDPSRDDRDTLMLVLEYVDPDGTLQVLTGWQNEPNPTITSWLETPAWAGTKRRAVVMDWIPTDGIMTANVPSRITLNRMGGQFDTMTGMYYQQAKLMALEVMAVEKGVFPDTYLVSRPGETARFIDGPYDGRSGLVNVVSGGDIRSMNEQPGYMAPQVIDRLERAQRLTGGLPSDFGGESGTNIRTGRRGDAVLSAVIDFPIAENQAVMAQALVDEDRAAIALAKRYDGTAPRTIYLGTGNTTRAITYIANDVFKNDEHVVTYPVTGADLNSLLIGMGQRVGLGTMSKRTGAEMDPYIADPEAEHDRIIAEGLEQALMAGVQQQASAGALPPLVLAKIMTLVQSDKMELAEAMNKVAEDAAREQAAQQAQQQQGQGGPPMTADQMSAPAAQQALAGPSPIPGASPGQAGLASLLSTLRKPTMTIQPMKGAARGAM